jgi:hypothetical protein
VVFISKDPKIHLANADLDILSDDDGIRLNVVDKDTNKIVASLLLSKEQSRKIGEILTHAPNW